MYQIKELHSDTITESEIQSIIEFCDSNSNDSNYRYQHHTFEQDKNNWYTLMFKEGRFLKDIGGLCVAYEGDNIIAISGYSQSDINPNIFIGGIRTLKAVDHRDFSTIIEYIIPYQRQTIIDRGGRCVIFLIETEKQASFYRLARNMSVRKRIKNEDRNYYTTFSTLDYPIHINNSILNVVYEYLDPNYKFDWQSLSAVGS